MEMAGPLVQSAEGLWGQKCVFWEGTHPASWPLLSAGLVSSWELGSSRGSHILALGWWCKRESLWMVWWDLHLWAPDSSNPCLQLGRERQAMPELNVS